jgi:hypothetical protein
MTRERNFLAEPVSTDGYGYSQRSQDGNTCHEPIDKTARY